MGDAENGVGERNAARAAKGRRISFVARHRLGLGIRSGEKTYGVDRSLTLAALSGVF
jgi:hypothetical protein